METTLTQMFIISFCASKSSHIYLALIARVFQSSYRDNKMQQSLFPEERSVTVQLKEV